MPSCTSLTLLALSLQTTPISTTLDGSMSCVQPAPPTRFCRTSKRAGDDGSKAPEDRDEVSPQPTPLHIGALKSLDSTFDPGGALPLLACGLGLLAGTACAGSSCQVDAGWLDLVAGEEFQVGAVR